MAREPQADASAPKAAKPFADGRQRELLELLRERHGRLAQTYEGALRALASEDNPDCVAQAAHSIRELFDALPIAAGVHRLPTADLGAKVAEIEKIWSSEITRTASLSAPDRPVDEALRKLIQQLADFFRWFREDHPAQSVERDMALDHFDPHRGQLPEQLRRARGRTLEDLKRYMNAVLHHQKEPSRLEFATKLGEVEAFLRSFIKPTPLADRKTIDEILKGGG